MPRCYNISPLSLSYELVCLRVPDMLQCNKMNTRFTVFVYSKYSYEHLVCTIYTLEQLFLTRLCIWCCWVQCCIQGVCGWEKQSQYDKTTTTAARCATGAFIHSPLCIGLVGSYLCENGYYAEKVLTCLISSQSSIKLFKLRRKTLKYSHVWWVLSGTGLRLWYCFLQGRAADQYELTEIQKVSPRVHVQKVVPRVRVLLIAIFPVLTYRAWKLCWFFAHIALQVHTCSVLQYATFFLKTSLWAVQRFGGARY